MTQVKTKIYKIVTVIALTWSLNYDGLLPLDLLYMPLLLCSLVGEGIKKCSYFFQVTTNILIELIDSDGFKPWGWPISFEDSSFQSSPILHDIDSDGNIDIGVVDKNANLYWIRTGDFGEYLENYHIQIPKLKIKRNWAEHLDPNFVDSNAAFSMFDRKRKRHVDAEDSDAKVEPNSKKSAKLDELNVRPKITITIKQDTYPELNSTVKVTTDSSHRRLEEVEEGGESGGNDVEKAEAGSDNAAESQGSVAEE
eukprot:CAMPEP_0170101382 /NCGR_PEP_ID=MMETSP0020_2-20130122/2221_1 /TAXON_ID=98059 /ORGANISM="Dinobryon sp., Strain UTEXLB2267" /LENGTH=252 /DNA_ID=CAMNT_0010324459 /DNA_START=257 /DNA_END=1012 /DNA_ORIENTATION=-